ncbi:MAG TPA: hypothetical protein VE422_01645 [Terriglobia bacterium]|nr:hypothetical protein [Terriglobia bacterium]
MRGTAISSLLLVLILGSFSSLFAHEIVSITPGTGVQGETLTVTIRGNDTNFIKNPTTVNMGAGISVGGAQAGTFGPVEVVDKRTLRAVLRIAPGANVGARTVRMRTAGETPSLEDGFIIRRERTSLVLEPDDGHRGQAFKVRVEVRGAELPTGQIQARFGDGISVGEAAAGQFGKATQIDVHTVEAEISIGKKADLGDHNVTLRSAKGDITDRDAFTVREESRITKINPDQGFQGQQLEVTIRIDSDVRLTRVTPPPLVQFGDGISVGNAPAGEYGPLTAVNNSTAKATIAIRPGARVGTRRVKVKLDDEEFGLSRGFEVLSQDGIISLDPDRGKQGQSLTVLVRFRNDDLKINGKVQARFGDGISVGGAAEERFGDLKAVRHNEHSAELKIAKDADPGPRDIEIRWADTSILFDDAFTVTPVASLTSITPNSGRQGDSFNVAIIGTGTAFATGSSQLDLGPGIAVDKVTVSSATSISSNISIANDADPGARTVRVTTGSQIVTLTNGFTVLPGLPRVTSVTPSSAKQGDSLSVAITGQFTHFAQNSTQVSFGGGISVTSLTVNGATSLTAGITVSVSAASGARDVTITSGSETVTATRAFTVNPGVPIISALLPNSGQKGQTLPVTVTALYSHFVQGTTRVDLGSGMIVDNITVNTPMSLTARVTVDRGAIVGARKLTVSTGSEVLVSDAALNVLEGPRITAAADRPPNAAGWYNSPVTVTFTCSDAVSPIATCPPAKVVSTEGRDQEVSGTAVNAAGVDVSVSIRLSLDKTPPLVALTAPANGAVLLKPEVTIAANVTDALSGITSAVCNGSPAPLNGNAIGCQPTLNGGANTITTAATDAAGNTGTASLSLTYSRAPLVTITSPANLSYLSLSPTTVTGTVDDPAAVVTVNSLPVSLANGQFSLTLPIAEGPTIITASGTAAGGAVGTASIEVTLDTTPPHVQITSPPDRFETTESSISVAGIVNDIVVGTVNEQQAQVTVNSLAAQVSNRTFLQAGVPLAIGENTIRAVARDRVGNTVATEITVTRRPASTPHIRLVSGNNQIGAIGSVLPSPLAAGLTDQNGNPAANKKVIFKVTQNDGLVRAAASPAPTTIAMTNAQGEAQVEWTLGMRAGAGGNSVEAYSVGFDGTAIFSASGALAQPAKIVVDTGNDQIGAIDQPLPRPLIAVVVDTGNNRLADVPVTFSVKEGGGSFGGRPTFTVNTDSDGRAAATLTLGLQEGNANNVVLAGFPSNPGFPATFTASGRAPGDPAKTTISGVVLDNNNIPIPGVTIRAVLTSQLNSNRSIIPSVAAVQTDAQGQFLLTQAPVGYIKLLIDGLTAQRPGTYPMLEYDFVTVAGQDNNVGQAIYLLPLNEQNKLCVTASTGGGTLTIADAPGFSLTFSPGQVTFPGGAKEGCISVTVVHGDKVPMAPGFGQQPRFIVTIQPPGAVFNPPATITMPNVDGLRPREVTEMYSFDHDINSFVAIGTGVVSDDGQVIRSSPGVGVLKAGWHCGGNPSVTGSAANCPSCRVCDGTSCVVNPAPVPCDDGRFCTDNDRCSNGACAGTQKPDIPGGTTTLSLDLDQVMGPVRNFLRTLFGLGAPDLGLNVSIETTDTQHCCDTTQTTVDNKTVTGSATASISTGDIPLPGLAVSLPFNITAGLFASVTLSASGAVTGTLDRCTNATSGALSGGISLSGAVKAQLSLPAGIASASASGSMGVSCNFSGPIQPGAIPCTGNCGNNGIVLRVTAQFVNGLIQQENSFVVLPPDRLPDINFFLPSPL